MNDLHPTIQAILEGENLDLVVLVELDTAAGPLRYAIDDHPRTWNGNVFTETGGGVGDVEQNAERGIPSLQLSLQNRNGVLGPLLHPAAGGEDVRGRRCTLRQGVRDALTGEDPATLVLEWVLFVNDVHWIGKEAVVLELGVFPAEIIRVPGRTLQGEHCWWNATGYKGVHCGYAGDLPTCEGTLDDCRRHFVGEPLRFGAFPSQGDGRALVV